jgi:NADPH:quinone reductase
MAQAIRIHETGGPEVLRLESVGVGEPAPGQVRIRHQAIGLNFIDTYHRSGLYPLALPAGIGMEAAGVVEAIGAGVAGLSLGDRVAYAAGPPGAYADVRLVSADRLVPIPDAVDAEAAAAVLLKGMTVEMLVQRVFAVQPGMTILFHAAAGGVGLLACQWLAGLGATVIGTVGSDEKAAVARANGCHHTIVYTREDFVDRVREITGGAGVPVAYDSVGKATFAKNFECMQKRGMVVGFGNASGPPDPIDPLLLVRKGSLFMTRPSMMDYTADRDELLASAEAVFDRVARGILRVSIGGRWPLADAVAAHRALEARRTTGSSLLLP